MEAGPVDQDLLGAIGVHSAVSSLAISAARSAIRSIRMLSDSVCSAGGDLATTNFLLDRQ